MSKLLVEVLERMGVLPSVTGDAERARAWLAERENGPEGGVLRGRPHRGAHDSELARLAPAIRALFGFKEGGIRIIPTARHMPGDEHDEVVWPEGEAIAAPELLYLLRRSYTDREVQITPSRDLNVDGKWKQCNLVILGGPSEGANEAAREVWPQLDIPYRFSGNSLMTKDGEVICTTQRDGDHVHDCAVFVKAPSPFTPNRGIVLMAGVLTQGTCAAGVYVKSKEWLRQVVPAMRRESNVSTVWWAVTAGVNDPWPTAGEFRGPVIRS